MKLKKVTALVLAGLMTFSLAACGGNDTPATNDAASTTNDAATTTTDDAAATTDDAAATELSGNLTIWTWTEDLQTKAECFMEKHPGVTIETVITPTEDYPTKIEAALGGGDDSIDIFGGEPQMLPAFMEAGFFEDLDQAPYNAQDYASLLVDYTLDVGKDADGIQRAISYQITPAGFYYRRDIAEKVFNTSDPDEVGKLFADYPTLIETGKTLKAAGYKLFASDAALSYMSGEEAWVVDGKLNLAQCRLDYMDMCVALYQEDLTAYAAQWTAPWYQAMSGPVPILNEDVMWGNWEDADGDGEADLNVWDAENFNANVGNFSSEEAEVFAFGLPSWGALIMKTYYGDTAGQWGICAGPEYGSGGGTWIGISSLSKNKELAWEFIKFCTMDEEHTDWWIDHFDGAEMPALVSALEKHADDENEMYGGQKIFKFWLEQAEGIDYSKVTTYDKTIGDAWGVAITKVKKGEASKEDAIAAFYDDVEAAYPDLIIER